MSTPLPIVILEHSRSSCVCIRIDNRSGQYTGRINRWPTAPPGRRRPSLAPLLPTRTGSRSRPRFILRLARPGFPRLVARPSRPTSVQCQTSMAPPGRLRFRVRRQDRGHDLADDLLQADPGEENLAASETPYQVRDLAMWTLHKVVPGVVAEAAQGDWTP